MERECLGLSHSTAASPAEASNNTRPGLVTHPSLGAFDGVGPDVLELAPALPPTELLPVLIPPLPPSSSGFSVLLHTAHVCCDMQALNADCWLLSVIRQFTADQSSRVPRRARHWFDLPWTCSQHVAV